MPTLLFQDARNLEQRMAELGEYDRPVTVRGGEALRLLAPERDGDGEDRGR